MLREFTSVSDPEVSFESSRAANRTVSRVTSRVTSRSRVAVLFDAASARRAHAATRLAQGLADAADPVAGVPDVPVVAVEAGDGDAADPYGVGEQVTRLGVDAAVLVAPRRRGSRRLLPGPIVSGAAVGIVQADLAGELPTLRCRADSWSNERDVAAPWVVAAMAKNVFLSATETWQARLERVHATVDLRADRARRDDLLAGLRAGPAIVLYAGHGSPRGWAGYQALRIDHLGSGGIEVERVPFAPAGLMMAFACKTLARSRGRWPFGSDVVERGVTAAYLAPAIAVYTADAERLANIVVDLIVELHVDCRSTGARVTIADLMRAIEVSAAEDEAARRAWATFRLVGNPMASLF